MSGPQLMHQPMHQRAANTLESGRVVRYHAVPTVGSQTVGLHAWGVAVLCIYVTNGTPSVELLTQALVHDAAELFTGDVPFTVKRDVPTAKLLYRQLEVIAHDNMVMPETGLNPHDAAVLKLCDTLEGLIWCRKTETTGPVRDRWSQALERALAKFSTVLTLAELERATLIAERWEAVS